jgi:hypothetical protein
MSVAWPQKTAKGLGPPGSPESADPYTGFGKRRARVPAVAAAGSCKTPMRGFPGPPSPACNRSVRPFKTARTPAAQARAGKSHRRLYLSGGMSPLDASDGRRGSPEAKPRGKPHRRL